MTILKARNDRCIAVLCLRVLTVCRWNCIFNRPFSVHRVPRTNLMLMVVDARCWCQRDETPKVVVSIQPVQVDHILSFVRVLCPEQS